MTDLLIKLFIKDKENVKDLKIRGKYGALSSITGIVVNGIIIYCKDNNRSYFKFDVNNI